MAFRVTVEKVMTGTFFTGEKWTNIYHFDVADADTALSRGVAAGVLEMLVSYDDVAVSKVSVSVPGDPSQSRAATPGSVGTKDPTGAGEILPLFNTVRVILTDGNGKPELKYLRTAAREADLGAGVWSPTFVTEVEDDYLAGLLGLDGLCGPTDQLISGGSVVTFVQMRQLGWHRRVRPGFHRGWVPD